ncbi:UDP-3-O-(3-hydroxymyristoyl)glucosamine N-acyltransferase [Legionella shakespearei]|uniref:UDP-3-O-acylglucosamine N-acyltransferase n=1 Tax=Legionella shakespearei DSM 23087 TaxID=1122169 RepID=A0A0W0Z4V7_9GAMM|nr:UDP-3-O-(3-hydroxymyristoyl)glucosamine N-acyltransferase [Legionella shakespearei]KTD64188.1 UDP-3-O-[3-hydroxymyristoyl] glucosamine N-acyltransferase [Legionella shakespearei DSM 23087]
MTSYQFATSKGPFSLSSLARISGAELIDNKGAAFEVAHLATLSSATPLSLCMLHQKKYLKELKNSLAGACILAPEYVDYAPPTMHLLVHKNPYKAYALITQAFYPEEELIASIAPSAFVSPSAIVGQGCEIEHGAYIGKKVTIGQRCKIGVNTYIGDGVIIGNHCHIENNVSISHTVMGNKVRIYPGARIGQDGFGFASDADGHYKIPHAGGVVIGNDVEIGANTCIDRGSLDNTIIDDWCRIDNLVQIGHNVKVGKGSIIVAQAAIAGSSQLEPFVVLAGRAGVIGHLKIGRNAVISAASIVIKDVPAGAVMAGYPATPAREWHKQTVFLKKSISRGKSREDPK